MAESKTYREQAARLRREAEKSGDPELKRTMLDIARLYGRMTETLAHTKESLMAAAGKTKTSKRTAAAMSTKGSKTTKPAKTNKTDTCAWRDKNL